MQSKKIEHLYASLSEELLGGYSPDAIDRARKIMRTALVGSFNEEQGDPFSKFGGLPFAPKGFQFPTDKKGKHTIFIGQVNLSPIRTQFGDDVLTQHDGVLYFFGVINDDKVDEQWIDEVVVRYAAITDDMELVALPEDLEEYGVFEEQKIEFGAPQIEVPSSMSSTAYLLETDEALYEIIEELEWRHDECGIKLGGYPNQMQFCLFVEADTKSKKTLSYSEEEKEYPTTRAEWNPIYEAAQDWQLLLQIHFGAVEDYYFQALSVWEQGFNYGMSGTMYVLIKKTDLEQLDFSHTQTIFQGT
jgi:uncharacterized protein YwqG